MPRAQRRVPPGRVGAVIAALRVGRPSAQFRCRSVELLILFENGFNDHLVRCAPELLIKTPTACLDITGWLCLPPRRALRLRGRSVPVQGVGPIAAAALAGSIAPAGLPSPVPRQGKSAPGMPHAERAPVEDPGSSSLQGPQRCGVSLAPDRSPPLSRG